MRGLRYERIMASAALALAFAIPSGVEAQIRTSIDTAMPLPQDPVPSPAAADVQKDPAVGSAVVTPAETAADQAADPFASLDPADRPIAEKVREILNARVDRIFANKKERAAVDTFYQSRKNALIWFDRGAVSVRANAVMSRIKAADTDGLDPADYRIPNFAGAAGAEAMADAELRLTQVVLTYARHVQAGRFPFAHMAKDIDVPQQPPEPADVLAKIADAADPASALDEFSPPQEPYKKLKAKLAEMRGKTGGGANPIEDGPVLKLAKVPMEDPRVPLLRQRLGISGDPNDQHYDVRAAEAVKKYQRGNDLPVTGALDSRTIKELNTPARGRQIDLIIANMERWRWYPRDLGPAYVMVNIPDYQLYVFKQGEVLWNTRVVVGKPTMATPLLSAQMKYITVNPTWNVPPSIVRNEYLPALAQDPTVLARMGLRVSYERDGSVHISQPPGDANALGRLRFNFPNKFLVYQHDTPDKYMFAHETRAYSHGCMRILDPPKYAEVLLSIARPGEGWTAEKIKRMYGSGEQDIQFPTFIPVNLTYQTAFVDDSGQLQTRADIYGIDARMLTAIRTERGMIEMAQAKPQDDEDRPQRSGGGSQKPRYQTPQRQVGFFEGLFGSNYSRPTPPRRIR
jgi:murein L,D-transpeptidase YcbB/YkuD